MPDNVQVICEPKVSSKVEARTYAIDRVKEHAKEAGCTVIDFSSNEDWEYWPGSSGCCLLKIDGKICSVRSIANVQKYGTRSLAFVKLTPSVLSQIDFLILVLTAPGYEHELVIPKADFEVWIESSREKSGYKQITIPLNKTSHGRMKNWREYDKAWHLLAPQQ